MKFIFKFIVLFFTVGISAAESNKIPAGENYFLSGVFGAYHKQLVDVVKDKVKENPSITDHDESRQFIEYILKATGNSVEDQRIYHETMLKMMRDLIDKNIYQKNNQDISMFLGDLAVWMYTEVNLWAEEEAFVTNYLPEGLLEDSSKDFRSTLQKSHQYINDHGRLGGYVKNTLRDAHLHGDFPSHLFDIDETKIIRTPMVVREEKVGEDVNALVISEFKQFLKTYSEQGKLHIYFNLTREASKAEQSIKELESDSLIMNGVMVIRLDKNTSFYRQINVPEMMPTEEFQQKFIEALMGPGYSWSRHLQEWEWKESLKVMMSEVCHSLFQNKNELTIKDRRFFIDKMHLKIIKKLIERFHPASVNISCRVSIDRGPSTYSLLYLEQAGPDLTLAQRKRAATMIFAPGMLTHNRLMDKNIERVFLFLKNAWGY